MDVIDGAALDESSELFPHYVDEGGVSAETVNAAADEIEQPTGLLTQHETDLDASHRIAATSTGGDLSALLEAAPKDAKDGISRVLATALVASGSTRLFGRDGVAAYDSLVDDLRAEYRERKAEILAGDHGVEEATYPEDATPQARAAIDGDRDDAIRRARDERLADLVSELQKRQEGYRDDPLDAQAFAAAAQIEAGPTEEALVDLFAAGVLPSRTPDLFTDIEFKYEKPPSDLEDMTNEELAAYLSEHDELLEDEETQKLVEDRIEELSAEDGETDGVYIGAAGSPPVTMTDTVEAFGNLALVTLYGKYVQENDKQMPDAGADYLTAFYDQLDDDDTAMDVADWLDDSGYAEDWMTEAYANGLLEVSDPRLHDDFTSLHVPDEVWEALEDIPQVETESHTPWGAPAYDTVELTGGDGFRAFAKLISHSTVEPGFKLADQMTESVGELAGRISSAFEDTAGDLEYGPGATIYVGFEDALDEFAPHMQDVVKAAARNEEANEYFLHCADTAGEPDRSREYLTNLYTFPWPDDGEAVSKYTDWIAEYRASDDPDEVDLANRASASFINVVTDTGDPNTFKTLMTKATPDELYYSDDNGQRLSIGDVNPELVQGFGLVAGSNLDALGGDLPHHDTRYEYGDGSLSVSEDDRSRLFTMIATDDTATRTLSQTIGAYEQARLDAAIDSGDASTLQDAGAEANRLDGYVTGGMVNADLIVKHTKHISEVEAYKQHMAYATTGKSLLGYIPDNSGVAGPTLGLLYDGLVTNQIEAPEAPDMTGVDFSEVGSADAVRTIAAYDFVAAQIRDHHDLPPEIEALLEDGKLKPIDAYSSQELDKLDDHLAEDPNFLNYVEKNFGADPYEAVVINNKGYYHENEVESYLNGD